MPTKSFLVILNGRAGGNAAGRSDGSDLLRERACALSIVRSESPEQTLRAIHSSGDMAGVVIGGGDGTISLALPALIERGLPVGVLPLGTANDFARSIGVADLTVACDAIAAGHTRIVDLGIVGDRPFLNVVAIGLPAQAARELTAERKRRFGMLAAIAAAPGIALRRRTFMLKAMTGDQSLRARCEAVLVGVGRYVGGLPVSYEDIDDGELHLMACRALTLPEALRLALSTVLRRLPEDEQIIERAAPSMTVETSVPMDVAVDGDICAKTPIDLRIMPGALRVFAPAASM
ncbi:MAG: diacylglycerol/lipid kinase family protein [Vulcanimicrobiaceae bacterium]